MKLRKNQIKIIYDTIISLQECNFTSIMRHKLRIIRNILDTPYNELMEEMFMIYKNNGGIVVDDNWDFKGSSKEDKLKINSEIIEILNSERELPIEPIPLNIQLEQGLLPGKFDLNLDPILAKE